MVESLEIDSSVKSHFRKNFPCKRLLSEERLLQENNDGKFLGWIQSLIQFPQHLHRYFSFFYPVFKITAVIKDDIGFLMKRKAEKEKNLV